MDFILIGEFDVIDTMDHISRDFDVPFVYLTACSDEATLQRAKGTAPYGYVLKPFKERELHIVIEVALCRHEVARQINEHAAAREIILTATERAVRMRDDILAVVSHDLRSPLAGIVLSANYLLESMQSESLQHVKHGIEIIRKNARTIDRLIEDLCDIVSIDKGTLSLRMGSVKAQEVAIDALAMFEQAASQRSITLQLDVLATPILRGDRDRIIQVFANLIGNALKFSASGSAIAIGGKIVGNMLQFSVRDKAHGISPEQLGQLFDRGIGARQKSKKRFGLGLYISKGIVEAHGGTIWVESTPGVGSTFHFTIPLLRVA
jgi:signal transduction histidine kinase